MRKTTQHQVLYFSNLSENNKVYFIEFLLKNNICFQYGKENCIAKVSLRKENGLNVNQNNTKPFKDICLNTPKKTAVKQEFNKIGAKTAKGEYYRHATRESPKLYRKLLTSSMSCEKRKTISANKCTNSPKSKYFHKRSTNSKLTAYKETISPLKTKNQVYKIVNSTLKQTTTLNTPHTQQAKGVDRYRYKMINKYQTLFSCDFSKQRPIRWPTTLLYKTLDEIYDYIFLKNTQYLQNKKFAGAFRVLNQHKFTELITSHFRKKFKANKLFSYNLNNMLYSLSYQCSRYNCPIFFKTFYDFIFQLYQPYDLVFYLFSRGMIKKYMKNPGKHRDILRSETLTPNDTLKYKDVNKFLKFIVGKDAELLNEYTNLIVKNVKNYEIYIYELLRLLLYDYRQKRIAHVKVGFLTNYESFGNIAFNKNDAEYLHLSLEEHSSPHYYDRKNTEYLTFGYDSIDNRFDPYFWKCQPYELIYNDLLHLIRDKLKSKVKDLIEILSEGTMEINRMDHLQSELIQKAECLVKALFAMNKVKWFKYLNNEDPNEEDIEYVENLQMKVKELVAKPNQKEIGEFCKSILTLKYLVNQLEKCLLC